MPTRTLTFAAATLVAPLVCTAALKPYTGGDGTLWSAGGSWSSGVPTSGADNVSLRSDTTSTGSTFDLADGFTITGLSAAARSIDSSDGEADHTINLNGRTLNVQGNLVVGQINGSNSTFDGAVRLDNGSLNLTNGNLDVGDRSSTTSNSSSAIGLLTGTNDAVFTSSNLARLTAGTRGHAAGSTAEGTIDFTGVAAGTLDVAAGTDNVLVGVRLGGSSSGNTTVGTVTLGSNWTSTTFGDSTAARADFRVGSRNGNASVAGAFTQAGGSFSAYLDKWFVGYTSGGSESTTTTGTVDLTGVTSLAIDVNSLEIGPRNTNHSGTVTLPTGDVLINNAATIGGGTKGTLNLNRTDFAVASAATLTLGTTGEVNSTIGGVSAGIDIANSSATALVISSSAQVESSRGLEIVFQSDPLAGDWAATAAEADGIFYGFKWAGDQVANLTNILNGADNVVGTSDDLIRWDDSALTGQFAGKVGIFYDGIDGLNTDATYIGFYTVIPEPASLALAALGALVALPRRRGRVA